jgi:hypothetical protein
LIQIKTPQQRIGDIRRDPPRLTRNQRVSFDEPGPMVMGTDLVANR